MARQRNPNRDEAMKKWIESGGEIETKKLAEFAGVPESRIRKWKSEDGWKEALSKKKRGGQRGNTNATGHGAPTRNKNAETHGAYATVYFDELTDDEKTLIDSITLDTQANMLRELQTLVAKENDLKKRIKTLELTNQNELYVDKVVQMLVPKKRDDEEEEQATQHNEELKTAMQTVIKASPFDRAMKLEAELNKIHGRIIKLLDSIKSYELEARRIELEEKKYRLAKQKVTGEFDIDPETGEINDDFDVENEENP